MWLRASTLNQAPSVNLKLKYETDDINVNFHDVLHSNQKNLFIFTHSAFISSFFWVPKPSRDISAETGFPFDKPVVLGGTMK